MYYSNYLKKDINNERGVLIHTLNGKFIIFKNKKALSLLDKVILNDKDINESIKKTINYLLDEGFILKDNLSKDEEYLKYKNYYLAVNKSVFFSNQDGKCSLSIPINNKIKHVELNEIETKYWLKINSKASTKMECVEREFNYFNKKFNYKENLFHLVKNKDSTNKYNSFYNIYIKDAEYYKKCFNTVYLKLTDACNLNCAMCGQAKNKQNGFLKKNNMIDFEMVKKFLAPVWKDIQFINLWGGEPLLHPEIKEILKFLSSQKKYISIATNGTYLNKYCDEIVNLGVDEIVVSLDGTEEIHNDIRGCKNAFQNLKDGIKKISTLKKFLQVKPNIIINCTITERNQYILDEILQLSVDFNVNKIFFQLPIFLTQYQGNDFAKLSMEKWNQSSDSWLGFVDSYNLDIDKLYEFYKMIKNEYSGFANFYNISFKNKEELSAYFTEPTNTLGKSKCNVMHSAIVIEADGTLVSCPDFPDIKFGNIKSCSFNEFLQNDTHNEFNEEFKKRKGYSICSRCCQYS